MNVDLSDVIMRGTRVRLTMTASETGTFSGVDTVAERFCLRDLFDFVIERLLTDGDVLCFILGMNGIMIVVVVWSTYNKYGKY